MRPTGSLSSYNHTIEGKKKKGKREQEKNNKIDYENKEYLFTQRNMRKTP
jgi:hypothetical protein